MLLPCRQQAAPGGQNVIGGPGAFKSGSWLILCTLSPRIGIGEGWGWDGAGGLKFLEANFIHSLCKVLPGQRLVQNEPFSKWTF